MKYCIYFLKDPFFSILSYETNFTTFSFISVHIFYFHTPFNITFWSCKVVNFHVIHAFINTFNYIVKISLHPECSVNDNMSFFYSHVKSLEFNRSINSEKIFYFNKYLSIKNVIICLYPQGTLPYRMQYVLVTIFIVAQMHTRNCAHRSEKSSMDFISFVALTPSSHKHFYPKL